MLPTIRNSGTTFLAEKNPIESTFEFLFAIITMIIHHLISAPQ